MTGNHDDLRFGVIGCGHMATYVHCPNMADIPGAQTVAYCDLDESKAQALLDQFGGQYATTEANDIFADASIDGVLIQVGPSQHARLVQGAARAGKHIFVEKPLAADLADAVETVRVVERAGVTFVFGTCFRYAPAVRLAKRMCPNPLYSYSQAAASVVNMSPHSLDLAVGLFHEAPLQTVYASGGQFWGMDPGRPADSFGAVLTFADGSVHNYFQHGRAVNVLLTKYHYQLFGRDCCVYLAKRFRECHHMTGPTKVDRSWIFEGENTDRGPFGYMGHYEELAHLVECIRTRGQGTTTVRDGATVLAVQEAIFESVRTRQIVDFSRFLVEREAALLLTEPHTR